MFGYYYYNDPRRPDPGDVFGSVMTFLVIFGIIFGIVLYFGFIVLMIFLGIGVLIGLVYAIIAYVRAFIEACKTVGGVMGKTSLTTMLLRWWHLFRVASVNSLKANFHAARGAFVNAGQHKFLSFKKWMWFIVGPSVLIFGTAMILVVAFLQVSLVAAIIMTILSIIFFAFLICLAIGLGYSLVKMCISLVKCCISQNLFGCFDFSRYFLFADLGRISGQYFLNIFRVIGAFWLDGISLLVSNFKKSGYYAVFNPLKYYFFILPAPIMVVMIAYIAIFFVLFSVAYVPVLLAQLVWGLIAKCIK